MLQLLRTRRGRSKQVVDAVRTDITWQGKLGPTTKCACTEFRRWVREDWKIAVSVPLHEDHCWATLDWLLAQETRPSSSDNGALRNWIGRWQHETERTPLLATQPLLGTDREAIAEAARVATRMAILQLSDNSKPEDHQRLRESIRAAMKTAVGKGKGKVQQT